MDWERSELRRSPALPLPSFFACRPEPGLEMCASPSPPSLKFRSSADPDLEYRSANRSEPSSPARSCSLSWASGWADFSFLWFTPGSWPSGNRNWAFCSPWAFPVRDFAFGWPWKPPSALFWAPFWEFSWVSQVSRSLPELSGISSPPAGSLLNSPLPLSRFAPPSSACSFVLWSLDSAHCFPPGVWQVARSTNFSGKKANECHPLRP